MKWKSLKTFLKVCLPCLKKITKEKAVIGDKLGSHMSIEVIKQCQENNIYFILLPLDSTHLTQPLDVCVFRLLMEYWRSVLNYWKNKNRGFIPKAVFSQLLRTAIERFADKMTLNIQSGFKAYEIIPINRKCVLRRLPHAENVEIGEPTILSYIFIAHLENQRKRVIS